MILWGAPAATMIAAMMTAANLGARVTGWGFVVFALGSIWWALIGLSTGQTNLLATNAFLTLVNLVGIWRWLGRQRGYDKGGESAARASRRSAAPTLFAASSIAGMAVEAAGEGHVGHAVEAPPRIARADVLADRTAAGQGRFDITALQIDLSAPLHAKLVRQLERAGFRREDGQAGTRLRGDGLELLLRAVNDDPGLVSMSVATDTKLSRDLVLGSVRVVQQSSGSAQLRFGRLASD